MKKVRVIVLGTILACSIGLGTLSVEAGNENNKAMIIQPFNEVTFGAFVFIFLRATILFLAIIAVGFLYKVKSDEV
ncbi:hypothetical protein [Bacillus sp. mrc49]|uniref:hypothetical protein n=1 Tax=Bacillus sp. mrc49 TaxID=2054913 RepID=UPI000C27A66A|nr:hypothetical protein [Bacillus sp. mrc49]PJN87836.1 hypothetical protein CVN76_23645 [Bacillus sp. mrc49]PJN91586.1 hypothetical protein CVN76_04220 [Bacillus sp. mrc49]